MLRILQRYCWFFLCALASLSCALPSANYLKKNTPVFKVREVKLTHVTPVMLTFTMSVSLSNRYSFDIPFTALSADLYTMNNELLCTTRVTNAVLIPAGQELVLPAIIDVENASLIAMVKDLLRASRIKLTARGEAVVGVEGVQVPLPFFHTFSFAVPMPPRVKVLAIGIDEFNPVSQRLSLQAMLAVERGGTNSAIRSLSYTLTLNGMKVLAADDRNVRCVRRDDTTDTVELMMHVDAAAVKEILRGFLRDRRLSYQFALTVVSADPSGVEQTVPYLFEGQTK
ncbi:MAG: LEA type 2 family protein [Spirochaetes bacterium]|nr:LEA type 2 family protein [Spirochaetota bacterium]